MSLKNATKTAANLLANLLATLAATAKTGKPVSIPADQLGLLKPHRLQPASLKPSATLIEDVAAVGVRVRPVLAQDGTILIGHRRIAAAAMAGRDVLADVLAIAGDSPEADRLHGSNGFESGIDKNGVAEIYRNWKGSDADFIRAYLGLLETNWGGGKSLDGEPGREPTRRFSPLLARMAKWRAGGAVGPFAKAVGGSHERGGAVDKPQGLAGVVDWLRANGYAVAGDRLAAVAARPAKGCQRTDYMGIVHAIASPVTVKPAKRK